MKLQPVSTISQNMNHLYKHNEVHVLTKRLCIQAKRRPALLISGIIQPLLWLILFGSLFQNAPISFFITNLKYNVFLSPGIIVFTSFSGAINAGLPMMFDREFGFLNRILVSPIISRDCLLFSSICFITTVTVIQTLSIILFSMVTAKHIIYMSNLLIILLIITLITLSIASLSICLGFILPGHIEFLALIFIINLPTLFSSTALAPLSFMPSWLQILASLNPLTYAIESIRYAYIQNPIYYIHNIWMNLNILDNLAILSLICLICFYYTRQVISHKSY
uniref:ABC-2 type transporter n=2 Tax=Gelidium TaxID=2811 RepID=A0A411FT71_9FLOR|nr:ABC-2 type transporter [Gelidium coulteri]YP_009565347.1 ABC-2 type transporter [Gelidium sinicola]QBA96298.1 ABC-2 type transporter [Gelidium coulteri]QBA96698.1 ABC-2 type transporter [Gelidium sinicola]